MNKISIIVPILNVVKGIAQLLLHLENKVSKTVKWEIIVGDDGS